MIKSSIGVLILFSLAGCSLYSDNKAPVYDVTSSSKGEQNIEPAIVGQTSPSNSSGVSENSIERPGTKAVELNTTVTNPYQSQPTNNNALVSNNSNISNTNNNVVDVNNNIAGVPDFNDPRIQEASSILNNTESTASNILNDTQESLDKSINNTQESVNKNINDTKSAVSSASNNLNNAAANASNQIDLSKNTVVSEVKSQTTPATQALLEEARKAVMESDYEVAASALERAQRIEPQNPKILYDIAQIRYAQGEYAQAESFASKAASISRDDELSRKIWTLLGGARKSLGQTLASEAALQKAASF